MALKSLQDLLVHELQDLYSVEQQLTEALPKMVKSSANPELKAAFEDHLEETKMHLEQVGRLLETLDSKPGKVKCVAMAGIIKEGEETLKEDAPEAIKDAAIIGAAQRVEHYEIAVYGTVRAMAETLGEAEVAQALDKILEQEHGADEKLTELSEMINKKAQVEGGAVGGDARRKR